MNEKTFRLYNGVTYTDTTYEEIKYNNIPIGHFKKKSEIPKTILGTYLDNETNYN